MSRREERLGNYSIHSSAREAGSPSREPPNTMHKQKIEYFTQCGFSPDGEELPVDP